MFNGNGLQAANEFIFKSKKARVGEPERQRILVAQTNVTFENSDEETRIHSWQPAQWSPFAAS